ncbi:MAG: YbaB/EbfC family nucleoid-associated protein, partial [Clostridiales bacterium]|nr:YbaB/EbfC family nucleoid-associated protein [Clostridiales bacterium]
GGGNMNNLLKQAQKLQADMEKTQEELGNKLLEASSGGGAVKVTATGKKEIKSVTIDPDVLDDVDMLQDLVLTAVNEALRKADELTANEMKKFNLPF